MSVASPGTSDSRSGHCLPPPNLPPLQGSKRPLLHEILPWEALHPNPVLSGARDSEKTHSTNLQKRKCLGRNHYFKVLETLRFLEAQSQPGNSWLFYLRMLADDNASRTQGPRLRQPHWPLLSRPQSYFFFLNPVGTITAPKDAHDLIPRIHECVPLCDKKDFAEGTEVRVLRWEIIRVDPMSSQGTS